MSNELIVIEEKNALTVFTQDNGLDDIIKQVEMEIATFEHDLSTGAGRKRTASLANQVARTKTYLDGLGKDLVSDWKNKAKVVDANRKAMRDSLDELKVIARKPLTEWEEEQKRIEEEEAARLAAEKLREEVERDHEMALLMNAEFDRKAEEERIAAERAEQERLAKEAKERAEREARIAQEAKEKAEREAAEREAQLKREAAEAAEKAERERKEAIEREEQAKRDAIAAEERRKLEAEQAEKRRIEAEEKAKRDAEEAAERARQAEIQRQKDEEERQRKEQEEKAARVEHARSIHQDMKQAFILAGLNDANAELAVKALVNKSIPHIGSVIY